MINHVWGLLTHPNREWQEISSENETVSHLYGHHVLILAAVPVVCSFIGTTLVGWHFGTSETGLAERVQVAPSTAILLAIIFYGLILAAVWLMGNVVHWLARRYPSRPSLNRCVVFAGYMATPMFLSGIVSLYPIVWLCLLAGIIGLCYTAYLLFAGLPSFLGIDRGEGIRASSAALAIGILVLEALLALTVLLWSYGASLV
ncbi:YIP1 family protein [Salinicola endophyticus]|uniref:YIP1 family protein n=1 Tax=Salinicola endophyticus TaxID=1949083 RepID=A0ABY8FLX2_9GAMM|nr:MULTISPECIES: Yip1 family protein [Salinicola]WFF43045.1 YIP1 family protein [Salinicola endophyticus]